MIISFNKYYDITKYYIKKAGIKPALDNVLSELDETKLLLT